MAMEVAGFLTCTTISVFAATCAQEVETGTYGVSRNVVGGRSEKKKIKTNPSLCLNWKSILAGCFYGFVQAIRP